MLRLNLNSALPSVLGVGNWLILFDFCSDVFAIWTFQYHHEIIIKSIFKGKLFPNCVLSLAIISRIFYKGICHLQNVFIFLLFFILFSKLCFCSRQFSTITLFQNKFRVMKQAWRILKLTALTTEAIVRRCSVRKMFLKIQQNLQGNTCARVSFLPKLQACSFIKKETGTGAFL